MSGTDVIIKFKLNSYVINRDKLEDTIKNEVILKWEKIYN